MKRVLVLAYLLLAVVLSFSFSGCVTASPMNSFYKSNGTSPEIAAIVFELPSQNPRVFSTSDFAADGKRMLKEGFLPIGSADFTWSGSPTEAQIIKKAREVGADVVLYKSKYDHTETGVRPALGVIPGTTSTTTSSGTANAYGSGSYSASAYGSNGVYAYGSGTYSGSAYGSYQGSTTTTTDPQFYTYNVPYSAQVNSYGMAFYRHAKPPILGAHNVVLDEQAQKALGRNTGALVTVVVNNSPAFLSNLMPGDVITQVGQYQVTSPDALGAALGQLADSPTTVTFIRNNVEQAVAVKLNPIPVASQPSKK